MTAERHSQAESRDVLLDPEQIAYQEAENGIIQYELLLSLVREHLTGAGSFKLTAAKILRLHEAALHGIDKLAGTFRNVNITISGSRHSPPPHFDVADEVANVCRYVSDNWEDRSALHFAAYLLWRLNWIHPFTDGNGRTARAVSYYVLCCKIGSLLPGTPTIPEQIAADKGPYYDALEAADLSLQKPESDADVSKLEQMLERMLVNQLLRYPSLSQTAQHKLNVLVENRLRSAPPTLTERAYGADNPDLQLWSLGDHLLLQVGPKEEIVSATDRAKLGNPFPGLLAQADEQAKVYVSADTEELITGEIGILDNEVYCRLERDAVATVTQARFKGDKIDWTVSGAIHLVRLGTSVTDENFHTTMDISMARHFARKRATT